jgi:NOL1/NOP2/fmu family ribosome biogenesis protein
MHNSKFLNKKQVKEILDLIKKQWDCELELDYTFMLSDKDKVYIVNRDIDRIDLSKLRINSLGMYLGEIKHNEIRLTIEGAQLVGPHAKKNVVELDDKEARLWLKGYDIEKEASVQGFVIMKHNNDFLGSGRCKEGKISNFVPKTRRIMATD